MKSYRLLMGTALLASLVASAPAFAQVDNGSSSDDGIADIVVTARKRTENIQNIPLAVTVIGSESIANTQSTTTSDLARLAPSVTVQNGGQASASSFVIRGIGTYSYSSAAEPSIAMVVDGVVLARSGMAFLGLADIERVEVLRGPQGTLFGKNASAGVINIVSRDPSKEFSFDASASAISAGEYHVGATASGPITDRLAIRVTGNYVNDAGFITNFYDGSSVGGRESYMLRGVLVWDATDSLSLKWRADASRDDYNGPAMTIFKAEPGTEQALLPDVARPGNDKTNVNLDPRTLDKAWGTSLEANLDLGDYTITSISAFRRWREQSKVDIDLLPIDYFGLTQPDGQTARQWSQELRLASPKDKPVSYVAGLFYYRSEVNREITRTLDLSGYDIGFGPFPDDLGGIANPAVMNSKTESFAAFGEADYRINDRTRLTGGLRYTHDKLSFDYTRGRVFDNPATAASPFYNAIYSAVGAFDAIPTTTNRTSADRLTGKIALEYNLADEVMTYASFAKGYKGPAFDLDIGSSVETLASAIKPETSDAFEIGLKSRWLDNRLQVNIAAFHTTFYNFQAQTTEPSSYSFHLANVGKTITKGVELDLIARPASDWNINAGLAYVRARISEYPFGPCGNVTTGTCGTDGYQDLAGGRLPFSPDLKGYLSSEYRIRLPELPFDLSLMGMFNYQSSAQMDLSQDPTTVQGAYGTLDLSAMIVDKDERYNLTFFVRNVFNQGFVDWVTPYGIGMTQYAQIPNKYAERRFGLTLRYSFN